MKKLFSVVTSVALLVSLTACGSAPTPHQDAATQNATQANVQTATPTPEATTAKGIVDNKYDVEIVSAKTATDYQGNPAIVVTYNFTNSSTQNAALLTSVGANAFQNGVQCGVAVMMPDVMDAGPSTAQVQPGATVTADCAYSIKDLENPVTVQVGPLINVNGTVNAQMVFNLQ